MSCHISCLLMMLILGSPDCEWPLCLAIFHACSWCLFLALQRVSGHFALQYFMPAHLFLALQFVSGYFALQFFMPAHDASSWLTSQWVATLPSNISCLLMMLVLGSPASEWLFALQYFMPAHDACSWLSREWVATLPCNISCLLIDAYSWLSSLWVATLPYNISCLLMMLVLGSPGSEWLLCLAMFSACSWCLFLAL